MYTGVNSVPPLVDTWDADMWHFPDLSGESRVVVCNIEYCNCIRKKKKSLTM